MKVLVVTDPWITSNNGKYYMTSQLGQILKRYKDAFGYLMLTTRLKEDGELLNNHLPTDGVVDEYIPVKSLGNALCKASKKRLEEKIKVCDLVIARIPSIYAFAAIKLAKKNKKPYLTENMGCAWDAYWNHGIAGKLIAPYMYLTMKEADHNADFATYVTESYLQNKYPCRNKTIHASNVEIAKNSDSLLQKRLEKISATDKSSISLMTAAAVNVRYKGHEYVIKAMPELSRLGINVKYYAVGAGDQTYLKSIAEKCGVTDRVIFTGSVSHEEVFGYLDDTDIYIQPSLQEGLPRAMIEAMSRGCPCLGARTAGIPELIDDECVFERASVKAVVDAVVRILDKDLAEYAVKNFNKANNEYNAEVLNKRRTDYYAYVKKQIEG